MIDSDFGMGENYYPQVFLDDCKYVTKERKINNYIIDCVKMSSDSDEETLLEKIQKEKNSEYEENSDEEN